MDILFWILIGALIGWNFPEPNWAKDFVQTIKNYFNK